MTDNPTSDFGDHSPYAASTVSPSGPNVRPTGITVTSVLCIIGGTFSLLSGLMQVVAQIVGTAYAGAFIPAGVAGDAQRQWMNELQAAATKYLIPNIGLGCASCIVGIGFVVGGLALLKPTPWARTWVRNVLLAAIVIEVLGMLIYIVTQVEMFPILQRQFDVMMPQGGGGGGNAPSPVIFKAIQTGAMYFGYGMTVFWSLAKLGAFVWGRSYLNQQSAITYGAASTPPPPSAT